MSDPNCHPGARILSSQLFRSLRYQGRHPLAIPRVCATIDLIEAMGWLDPGGWIDCPLATIDQLARFHHRDYIAAVIEGEQRGSLEPERARAYNLGRLENPFFDGMFRRPATGVGGALLAAELLREGGVVFHPAGGTHHGQPGRASGFCYFNAPVLAIKSLLDQGLSRIYYLDVDAHHGDGVQDAFAGDHRVFLLSIHEDQRWPYTGAVTDRGGGFARNLPIPAGFNDTELEFVLNHAILPIGRSIAPEAVVVLCGADALADDPMSRQELSNRALWQVIAALDGLAPRLLILGGGGYNPWSVSRCWAGVWATLNRFDPSVAPTSAAETVLRGITWHRAAGQNPPARWLSSIADPPRPGPLRAEVVNLVEQILAP